jgi:hypothetical protein
MVAGITRQRLHDAKAQNATLQNEHRVILRLQGTQIGFNANLGVGGMTISMH